MKKLTKQEIIERLNKEIDWINYNPEDIQDYRTYFKVECKKCGNIYETTPQSLFAGNKCRQCYLKRHGSDEHNILNKLKDLYKDSIDFTYAVYKNIRIPIKCLCKYCNKTFEISPQYLKNGIQNPCPHCRKEQERLKYQELVLSRITKKFPNKFDCSKVFVINAKTPITLICNDCGTEFQITPDGLLNSKSCQIGCPKCSKESRIKNKTKTTEQFIKEAKLIYGNKYDYSQSIYKGDRKPIKIICPIHGPFITLPHYHLSKYGGTCPKCRCSSGELKVMTVLEQLKIPYIYQFKISSKEFSNCKHYVYLDFLISKNGKIMFIEYNGQQHYKAIKHFGGEERFEEQQIRDLEVKNYCKKHNFPLLIIPYNCSNKDMLKLIQQFYEIHMSGTNDN